MGGAGRGAAVEEVAVSNGGAFLLLVATLSIAVAAFTVRAAPEPAAEREWRTICQGQVRRFAGEAGEVEVRVR